MSRMAFVTLYTDPKLKYSVEEDAQGRLWLSIQLNAGIGYTEMHRQLNPGESRRFQNNQASLWSRVRAILINPRDHMRSEEEVEYRQLQGG